MARKIIYVPLENIDQRYTIHLHRDITDYLRKNKIEFIEVPTGVTDVPPPTGMFLHPSNTIRAKANQMAYIARLYEEGFVDNETKFFFSDIWFPGVEALNYLNYFYKVNPRITGILHAGSFTDTDFCRDMERWACHFENILFDMFDEIYVGSNFIKNDVSKKRLVRRERITVTGLPLDSALSVYVNEEPKENLIIFNGRNCDEKQPWLFNELKASLMRGDVNYLATHSLKLNKDDYYKLLSRAKIVISFAKQENFGYGVAEAVQLGCMPVVPDDLAYVEAYQKTYRYKTMKECLNIVNYLLDLKSRPKIEEIVKPNFIKPNNEIFKYWFL